MALGLGNSASGNGSISIVNNANAVSVLFVTHYGSAYTKTTSITDASGGTWNLRRRQQFQSPFPGAGSTLNASFITHEIWWKNDVTSTNRALTLNTSGSGLIQTQWIYQAITGSTTTSAPWDAGATFQQAGAQAYGQVGAVNGAPSITITTTQANSEVLTFLSEVLSSGVTSAGAGSGMTGVNNQTDGSSPNQFHQFFQRKTQAAAGAVTAATSNGARSFVYTVDAISGTSTGSSAQVSSITPTHSGNGSATSSVTYSAEAGDIVVIGIGALSHTNYCKVKSIVDSAGLTWRRRRQTKQTFAYTSNSSDRAVLEYWWANASSAVASGTITITFDTTSNLDYSQAFWTSYQGVGNTAKPWAAVGAGAQQLYSNAAVSQAMTPGVTSSTTGDELIGFFASLTKSPSSVPTVGINVTPMGPAGTATGVASTGTAQGVGGVMNKAPSVGSFAWNWNNNQFGYVSIGDALGVATGGAGDDSDLTAIPSVTSTDTLAPGNTIPSTGSYNALADELLIVEFATDATGGYMPATSISDGTLTYTRRGQTQLRALQSLGATQGEYTEVEVWWAHTKVAFTGRTLTINYDSSATSSHGNPIIYVHHIADVQDPAAPFDDNASAHGVHTYAHASVKETNPSASYTTSQLNDLILAWSFEYESSGSGAISTVGSGYTSITTQTRGTTPSRTYFTAERKTQAVAGASTAARADATGKLHWILVSDAISGTMTGSASDTSAVSATAGGATITVTVSLSTVGGATVSGTATGSTITDTVSLSSVGTATGGSLANANGTTLTETVSLSSVGAATGGALVPAGGTLQVDVSIIEGTADTNVTANGATITVTSSIIAGAATGGALASGSTLTVTDSLIEGAATGGALVSGATLTVTDSIIGSSPQAFVPAIITVPVSLIGQTPQATGGALVDGDTVTVDVSLFSSTDPPAGEFDFAEGATLQINVSLISGSAGATDALVPGALFPIIVTLIPGTAVGDGTVIAQGATLTVDVVFIRGQAFGNSSDNNGVRPRVSGGVSTTQGIDATARGSTVTIRTRLRPGRAYGHAQVDWPNQSPVQALLVQAGHAIEKVDDEPPTLAPQIVERVEHHHHTVERIVEKAGDAGTHTVERVIEHVINATVQGATVDAELEYDDSDDIVLMLQALEDA